MPDRVGRVGLGRLAGGAVLGAAAVYAAGQAWADARFARLRTINPIEAYARRPHDAPAMARALGVKVKENQSASITAQDIVNGRLGLRTAPLSPGVFTITGIRADVAGRRAEAEAAMSMSNRLSRRDAVAQLWLIEQSVRREDIKGALAHYHAALSVHPELASTLLPILAAAISEPEIRAALAPYITSQTRWAVSFLDVALESGDPKNIAALLLPIADSVRLPTFEARISVLIGRLAEGGQFELAQRVAAALVPQFNAQALRAFSVNQVTSDRRLGALAWRVSESAGVNTVINELGGFDVTADPFASGVAAMRVVPVRAGTTYVLSHGLGHQPGTEKARGRWVVSCAGKAATKLLDQPLPARPGESQLEFKIAVPANCIGLQFALQVRGSEDQQASSLTLKTLELRPE
jgi:hypothetical protein